MRNTSNTSTPSFRFPSRTIPLEVGDEFLDDHGISQRVDRLTQRYRFGRSDAWDRCYILDLDDDDTSAVVASFLRQSPTRFQ
ncbi:hypothetical protein KHP60_09620 [Microvirga sp. 3-52]|uniref:hypothetical protein n=1 Tax=Microvirga sp. 3-52 TaxID=2792425 RepID=UPI001AD37A97|nr:hypothetical protein [Microvirga sp. 3-52]MBO1905317.1 hypothetical protein [Microvirga sp. 3-52]MBS7452594.1 hypothetical protein [Microvirga sp. 3-52]